MSAWMRIAAAGLVGAVWLGTAAAQTAPPKSVKPAAAPPAPKTVARNSDDERLKRLTDLSEVLGGAHYLRVLCAGKGDQSWRNVMRQLLDLEAPGGSPHRNKMTEAFNQGYREEEEQFAACSPEAEATEGLLKQRGARFSQALAARYRN